MARPKSAFIKGLTEQKAVVISWLDSSKTAKGENIHWAKKGVRPIATVQPGYKNFYIIQCCLPKDGGRHEPFPALDQYGNDEHLSQISQKTESGIGWPPLHTCSGSSWLASFQRLANP